jgi:hypothetical protein
MRATSSGARRLAVAVQLGQRALDRKRGADRALGVVFLRDRMPEQRHDPVT